MSRLAGKKLGPLKMPKPESPPNLNLDDKCLMRFDDQSDEIEVRAQDLEKIEELGRGAYGVVEKMRLSGTEIIMAVKRIHSSINDEMQKRMLVELHACMKSDCCPQMVRFYGAMFREGDVWICMEVMDTSLDKFYRMTIDSKKLLSEMFIAKCALAVVEGLNFMKEEMKLIHRDVKPSNILLNKQGAVKICDFGISGHLTNSVAKTVNAGCKPYMPPERIEGEKKVAYDVRADVWSLGITLVEIASGSHPYAKWKTPFEQLKQVVREPAPQLSSTLNYSTEFQDFVSNCLTKDYNRRPKYPELLRHPFVEKAKREQFDMGAYIKEIMEADERGRESLLQNVSMVVDEQPAVTALHHTSASSSNRTTPTEAMMQQS
uniref:mitogen-activated protein kinase kinase n=1 Tax=Anisakis simplex TaxID=6269 RepID=A0A346RVK3_ANISI|nr:dual specificity mitogen-activated protein kinase kinase 6 [Anisakis simplex]